MSDLLSQARSILQSTPNRWTELAAFIPEALFTRKPAPGEWSAQECLQHLVDTERHVFAARVGNFVRGEALTGFDPDIQGTQAADSKNQTALAAEFAKLRQASFDVFDRITTEDLEKTVHHPDLGTVYLKQMINEWAGHDLMHTVQAERALMQPFIRDCGPWRYAFEDHDIEMPR